MGNFFGSIHVRTTDSAAVQAAVERIAQERSLRFLIAPPIKGWISVFPENHGQDEKVTEALARVLPTTTLVHGLVHDDDVFAYWYYDRGALRDRFCSRPDYFGDTSGQPRGGNAQAFAELLSDPLEIRQLAALLDADRITFETERFEKFAGLLGLPNALTAYEYLQDPEEREGIRQWRKFVHVPDLSAEKASKRSAAATARRELKRLLVARVLLADERAPKSANGIGAKRLAWVAGPQEEGVFQLWTEPFYYRLDGVSWKQWAAPAWLAQECDFPGDARVSSAVFSPSGRRLALVREQTEWQEIEPSAPINPSGVRLALRPETKGYQISIWDWNQRRQLIDRQLKEPVCAMTFGADEERLFVSTQSGQQLVMNCIAVLPGADQDRQFTFTWDHCCVLAAHPAGRYLALDYGGRLGLLDLDAPDRLRLRLIGGGYDIARAFRKTYESPEALRKLAEYERQLPASEVEMHRRQIEVIKQAALEALPAPNERLSALEFTPDGRWLVCGTNAGVRVFEWSELVAWDAQHVDWKYSAEAEEPADKPRDWSNRRIHAVAYDAARNRVLFSGAEGKVKYLDLDPNRTGDLLAGPDLTPIKRLALLPNRAALAMTREPEEPDYSKQKFQIWNYPALCRAAGIPF